MVAKKPTEKELGLKKCCETKRTESKKQKERNKKTVRSSKEANLKKLAKTKILDKFVKSNKGEWCHNSWTEFCYNIEIQGFTPIDFDQVGMILENKKQAFFTNNQ